MKFNIKKSILLTTALTTVIPIVTVCSVACSNNDYYSYEASYLAQILNSNYQTLKSCNFTNLENLFSTNFSSLYLRSQDNNSYLQSAVNLISNDVDTFLKTNLNTFNNSKYDTGLNINDINNLRILYVMPKLNVINRINEKNQPIFSDQGMTLNIYFTFINSPTMNNFLNGINYQGREIYTWNLSGFNQSANDISNYQQWYTNFISIQKQMFLQEYPNQSKIAELINGINNKGGFNISVTTNRQFNADEQLRNINHSMNYYLNKDLKQTYPELFDNFQSIYTKYFWYPDISLSYLQSYISYKLPVKISINNSELETYPFLTLNINNNMINKTYIINHYAPWTNFDWYFANCWLSM